MRKKIISIMLAVIMIFGLIPSGALPALAEGTQYKEPLVIEHSTTVSDMTFSGKYESSAVVITDNAGMVTFENVTFENVMSDGSGACVYIDSGENRQISVDFINCRFSNCSSKDCGGAICVKGNNVDIKFENTVASNCSSNMGGFMHTDGINIRIDGFDSTLIKDCYAVFGGAISVNGKNVESGVLIEDINFVSNRSRNNGGAVYASAFAKNVQVRFCSFYSNGAGISGGAAYADFNASMEVRFGIFHDNFADIDGDETSSIKTFYPTFICDNEQCTEENHVKFGTVTVYTHKPTSDYTIEKSNDGKYHVNNNEDWFSFYQDVNINGKDFAGETVVLENDIAAYNPIGSYADNKKFKGTFDGNGHTVNVSDIDADTSDKGVFSATEGAVICNLTVNGVIKGQYSLGGIVGNAVDTSFRNCKNYALIDGTESYGGGIVGCSGYNCTYNNCTNFGNIKMKMKAGGIVGRARPNTVILNALNFGDVSGEQYIGGLIGYEDGENTEGYEGKGVTVGNAHVLGSVTASVSDAHTVAGRSIPESVYELCLDDGDIVTAANEYINTNGKAADGWMYLELGEDNKPVFTNIQKIPAKSATCTEAGWAKHYTKGGKLYKDADCTVEIPVLEEWSGYVPALGHNYTSEVVKAPTCVENGLTVYHCQRCNVSYDEITNKTGIHSWVQYDAATHKCENCNTTASHIFVNGECVCGQKEAGPNEDYFYIINTGSVPATVNWKHAEYGTAANLEYSINNKTSFAEFSGTVELNPGDICYFRGENTNMSDVRVTCDTQNAALAVGGDIGTLLNEIGNMAEYPEYAFCNVFFNLKALTDISDLTLCNENTKLAQACFAGMFVGCEGLTEIPDNFLPATALAERCYRVMFANCTSLTTIPENLLPATELEESCYYGMFENCSALTVIPEKLLPAEELAENCYYNMFCDCENLTYAPDLPAKQLCYGCYTSMFNGCQNLSRIKVSFTEWGNGQNYETYWFLPSEINDTLTVFCPSTLDTVSRGVNCIREGLSVNIAYFSEVLFASAGGTGGTASVTVSPGRALPDIIVPVRTGYDFDGYYDLSGVKYYDANGKGTKVWNRTDVSTVLIAIWNAHEHTFSSDWTYDETKHWHEATCEHSNITSGLAEHTYFEMEDSNGIYYTCSECGYSTSADKKASGVILNSNKEVLLIGDTFTLSATVLPVAAENKTVSWSSLDSDIATVSANGVVTAKSAGATVITAETDDGGYKDFCLIRVAGLIPIMNTTAAVDYDNGIISGIAPMLADLDSFVETSEETLTLAYSTDTIGTGTTVNVLRNGEVVDAYTTVLFGDVNGDGIYDGTDSIIVNCLANGLLSREQVGEAVYMAADCNHDDVIDAADVAILEQAGIILAGVDQTKSEAELMTDSAYVKYLNLIDQTVETETTDTAEDEPTAPEIKPARPEPLIFRIVNAIALAFWSAVNFFTNLFD